ncbi:MAG: sigma-70 family RNA polymerase sigma factor [Solirubrobacteraceae bacterium]|nr:sigma-70 family RNA polymerase sigma factor [Solirubrobacteraceae bacterium]
MGSPRPTAGSLLKQGRSVDRRVVTLHGPNRVTDAPHEAGLLQQVAAGNCDAPLEELYDRYHRRVWAVGLRRLGDRGAAEDLVQETFVRLWRAAGRFDPERGTVGALLMTIAHHAAADLAHQRARQTAGVLLHADVNTKVGRAGASMEVPEEERLLLRDELQAAIGALSPAHREVLHLHFHEDLTQIEIARRLDLPLGTVKSRVFYSLRQLRAAMTRSPAAGLGS